MQMNQFDDDISNNRLLWQNSFQNYYYKQRYNQDQLIIINQLSVRMKDWTKYNEQQHMPQLLSLERVNANSLKKTSNDKHLRYSKIDNQTKINTQKQKENNFINTNQFQQQRTAAKLSDLSKQKTQAQKKKSQISKALINQMINKMSLKSVSQQNYPITNQTIYKLLQELDDEANILKLQRAKFQNVIALNSINKKQLLALEKSINKLNTIKELYLEKLQHRNKISGLQNKIMELKLQNRELKIKISRGIEKIEGHIHNLPCQRQKDLIQEVDKYKMQLIREQQMRLSLEHQIKSIVLNFKRFYVEADQARKIVTQQLKDIKEKEKQLNAKIHALDREKMQKASDFIQFKAQKNTNNQNRLQNSIIVSHRHNNNQNNLFNEQNMGQNINQTRHKHNDPESNNKTAIKDMNSGHLTRQNTNNSRKREYLNNQNNELDSKIKFNLEQQIQKMKVNQFLFNKMTKKH